MYLQSVCGYTTYLRSLSTKTSARTLSGMSTRSLYESVYGVRRGGLQQCLRGLATVAIYEFSWFDFVLVVAFVSGTTASHALSPTSKPDQVDFNPHLVIRQRAQWSRALDRSKLKLYKWSTVRPESGLVRTMNHWSGLLVQGFFQVNFR